MRKILLITFILIFSTTAFANKNKNTWDYPLRDYEGWVVKGSNGALSSGFKPKATFLKKFFIIT